MNQQAESSTTQPDAAPKAAKSWSARVSWTAAILGCAAFIIAALGTLGAGADAISKIFGLYLVGFSALLGIIAIILTLIILLAFRKKHPRLVRFAIIGALLSLAPVGYLFNLISTGGSVPPIHDITTDLDNPPIFRALKLRSDNLANMPGADDPAMEGLDELGRWKALHRAAYGNIKTVSIDLPVADVIKKAEVLAIERGWDVAVVEPASGRLEVTDTVSLFRFKDDLVVRAKPAKNPGKSIVDVRSVSRVGLSDLGVNAKRIESFLDDLQD